MMLLKLLVFSSRRSHFFVCNPHLLTDFKTELPYRVCLRMPRHLHLLISLLLLCLAPLSAAQSDRVQFYYNLAEGNYLIGDLGGAERGIEQSLRLEPAHTPSLALKAKILLERSEGEAALEAVNQAIEAAPEKLEYQLLRALILGNLNQRDAARAQIETILNAAEPSSEEALTAQRLKGLLNMADERWDEAADAFQQTYKIRPETATAERQLASEAYLEKARTAPNPKEALAAMDQAIALYAGASGRENLEALADLKLTRAKLLAHAGLTNEAILTLQELVGKNSGNLEATVTLASIYAIQEEWTALEDLIAPIARNPLLADVALYLEGRVALSRDRVGTARAKFEEALARNMTQPTALQQSLEFYQSICFERLERFDKSEESLKRAISGGFSPETPTEAVHLGRVLMRIGDVDTMLPILEKALMRNAASAEGWAILGRAHLKKEHTNLAISALNQSLALEPKQSSTLALRGSLLRKIGDLDGALADYERAHRLEPSSPVLSYERGLVLLQLGRINEAESMLETAARKLSTHVTLELLHASCAYAIGEYEKAAQSLREYLAPELSGETLERSQANLSDTAAYLYILLSGQDDIELPKPLSFSQAGLIFKKYTRGEATRKEVLDWAGRADTPEAARSQICAAAYWLAQFERVQGKTLEAKQLLKIAAEFGNPNLPEYQFADWLLAEIRGNL